MKRGTYRPFEALRGLLREDRQESSEEKPAPSLTKLPENLSDDQLFELGMKDVLPLGWSDVPLPPSEPVEIQNPQGSEDEGLRLLTEFVAGKGSIDLRASGEYIEGAPHPRGVLLLDQLRSGHFAVQAHLDLHGMAIPEARETFEKFVHKSLQQGHGCIRIVHGRGHHSSNGQAVLKQHLQKWLNSRRMGRHIVAYTSARLCDGGGGALYVLLRRRPPLAQQRLQEK